MKKTKKTIVILCIIFFIAGFFIGNITGVAVQTQRKAVSADADGPAPGLK